MNRLFGFVAFACSVSVAAPAFACDTSGRLDAFALADRADSVFVGRYDSAGAFTLVRAVKGRPILATSLREGGHTVECQPVIRSGGTYLVFLRSDGAPLGAYRAAIPVRQDEAPDPLVDAVVSWLVDRNARRRRGVLTGLLADGPPGAAREAAFALALSDWWRPLYARRLEAARCREVRVAFDGLNAEWNRTGLRRRVLRDFDRACPAP